MSAYEGGVYQYRQIRFLHSLRLKQIYLRFISHSQNVYYLVQLRCSSSLVKVSLVTIASTWPCTTEGLFCPYFHPWHLQNGLANYVSNNNTKRFIISTKMLFINAFDKEYEWQGWEFENLLFWILINYC